VTVPRVLLCNDESLSQHQQCKTGLILDTYTAHNAATTATSSHILVWAHEGEAALGMRTAHMNVERCDIYAFVYLESLCWQAQSGPASPRTNHTDTQTHRLMGLDGPHQSSVLMAQHRSQGEDRPPLYVPM